MPRTGARIVGIRICVPLGGDDRMRAESKIIRMFELGILYELSNVGIGPGEKTLAVAVDGASWRTVHGRISERGIVNELSLWSRSHAVPTIASSIPKPGSGLKTGLRYHRQVSS